MALIRELEDNGCSLRGSAVCKLIKSDVTRCVACEYQKASDQTRTQVAVKHYLDEGTLVSHPVVITEDPSVCALCRGESKNPATTKAYAKITNKSMDVKRDLAGSGGTINGGEIDIEAPACKPCMQNIAKLRMYHYTFLWVAVILACLSIVAINLMFSIVSSPAAMMVFFGCVVGAAGLYYLGITAVRKAIEKKTCIQVLDLPALKGFGGKGWYVRNANRLLPTLHRDPPVAFVDARVEDANRRADARREQKKRRRMERMREM
jgi:hypothetical protein